MDKLYDDAETGCCPRFNPEPWDEKQITWWDKLFLKDHVRALMHIPLGFDKMMVRNMDRIKGADALPPESLMLCDSETLWGMDVHIAVGKKVPGAEMEKISGTFLSKVFEGPYKDAGKWMKQMQAYVRAKDKKSDKYYSFYTTCPKCAEYYGKNYTVLMAKI